ncbi:basic amino acid ABC transporter substrate-binding protein [Capillibacterium thermochitinicola]|uniref:Basic amino acid ABC transporter substrate-binding protein n=1 Tax=Capillibacterium thermochitinicola TaxID=2699427 RepID=A0A8J6LIX1_9FIRM|nr:basic amino acid ABC transporter substrate-binding protein [Capillibacterium thermochitinicola]MBA2133141.1 basic amino acid ABC transporter substrate-binding protein [Capillibacterium thermochitinicola]
MKKKSLLYGLIALVVIVVVALVGFNVFGPKKETGTKPSGGVLVVGCDAAFPPFEYLDEETGELLGFDLDLMRAIGAELGMEVEIKNVSWDGIIPGLLSGNYDVIASGMTITEERKEVVNFSDPYINAGLVIVTRAGDNRIKGPEDLAGKRLAVQINSTGDLAATEMMEKGIAIASIKRFNQATDPFLELKNGAADAVVMDLPVAGAQIKANPGQYQIVGEAFTTEEYGLALRKSDTELLAKINQALATLKANGTYDEIYRKYFGE